MLQSKREEKHFSGFQRIGQTQVKEGVGRPAGSAEMHSQSDSTGAAVLWVLCFYFFSGAIKALSEDWLARLH